jgi:hypothetical protein
VREKERAKGGVIELSTVVTLDTPDDTVKLRGHVSKAVKKGGEGAILMAQSESS